MVRNRYIRLWPFTWDRGVVTRTSVDTRVSDGLETFVPWISRRVR